MRIFLLISLLLFNIITFCQYNLDRVAYDTNGTSDTLYSKTNTDSLFRKVGNNYTFATKTRFKRFVQAEDIIGATGGGISQETLDAALLLKQNLIATGSTAQYIRGDGSLSNFPTTTAGFSSSVNKNFVTDTQLTTIGNQSGTNSGDNAANTTYANDYRASNFVAGTNYLAPNGNGSQITNLTKSQVGLSNVDNTSDANKPISTLTQNSLDNKLSSNGNGSSLTGLTKSQVGLSNVDNESKATMFTNSTFTGITRTTGSLGYSGAGTGGTVTQATSKTTGVTLNKICGQITMNGAALAAGVEVAFTLTNSMIASTDVIIVNVQSVGTAGSYLLSVGAVANGSCSITVSNASAGSLSQAIVLNFVVIKSVSN